MAFASLRDNLDSARERLAAAAQSAGRRAEEIKLVVVTKGHPASRVREMYDLGVRAFGESRVQEFLPKAALSLDGVEWHFIGKLQQNKINKVLPRIDLLHSVESLKLAAALQDRAARAQKQLPVLLEVKTAEEGSKGGFDPPLVREAYAAVREMPNLTLRGLMTIAPHTGETAVVRAAFRRMRSLFENLQADRLQPEILSMGMSDDFEIAVQEGATLVRLGRTLMGPREQA